MGYRSDVVLFISKNEYKNMLLYIYLFFIINQLKNLIKYPLKIL